MLTEVELNWIRRVLSDYDPLEIEKSPIYFYKKKIELERSKNKGKVRKDLDKLRKKMMKVTPEELLNLRNKSYRESRDIEYFAGIYIIHNLVKDIYYVGKAERVFDRAFQHFVINAEKNKRRFELNVQYNLPEIYYDYSIGDKFCISLIPIEKTSFSSLNELEDNAIRAYDSLVPHGYNRNPGNVIDKAFFKNDDYEKAGNLILDRIKGTEVFFSLTNQRKRITYTRGLFAELDLPQNASFIISFANLMKESQKNYKVSKK